jgi:hypothetical protein
MVTSLLQCGWIKFISKRATWIWTKPARKQTFEKILEQYTCTCVLTSSIYVLLVCPGIVLKIIHILDLLGIVIYKHCFIRPKFEPPSKFWIRHFYLSALVAYHTSTVCAKLRIAAHDTAVHIKHLFVLSARCMYVDRCVIVWSFSSFCQQQKLQIGLHI